MRVFISSERLANHLKINEIGGVGHLMKKIKIVGPTVGNVGKSA